MGCRWYSHCFTCQRQNQYPRHFHEGYARQCKFPSSTRRPHVPCEQLQQAFPFRTQRPIFHSSPNSALHCPVSPRPPGSSCVTCLLPSPWRNFMSLSLWPLSIILYYIFLSFAGSYERYYGKPLFLPAGKFAPSVSPSHHCSKIGANLPLIFLPSFITV